MGLPEGGNPPERLARTGPMRAEVVVDLMLPVCSALATAHAEGVVHRDLKPENVFVSKTRTGSEVVKVLDFGISSLAHDQGAIRLTATNSVIGTPRYMSPEQTKGAKLADARSDQWSVGVMMYQCLTGTLPYDGDSFIEILQKLANTKAPPPSKCVRGIPAGLDAAVMRTLSKDPKQRFPSMNALARALLPLASPQVRAVWEPAFAEGAPAPADVRPVLSGDSTLRVERPDAGSRGWLPIVAWGAAAALALALIALGIWYFGTAPARVPEPVITPLPPATSAIDPSPTVPAPPVVPPAAQETAAPPTVPPSEPERSPEEELRGEPRPSPVTRPSSEAQPTSPPTQPGPTTRPEPPTPPQETTAVGSPPPTSRPRVTPERRTTPELQSDEPRVGPNGAVILR